MKILPLRIFLAFIFLIHSCSTPEEKFDQLTGQKEVLTKVTIDSVLGSFSKVEHNQLDKVYIQYIDPENKFQKQLESCVYYKVGKNDLNKFIVGKYRLKNFIAHDRYELGLEVSSEKSHVYWLVDKKVLYLLLDFILELEQQGYDKYGFRVRESHRHPQNNTSRGGASKSQHIYGKAIDLVIEDLNRDGKVDQVDKEIGLKIAEEVVGSKGGVGRYPGTMTIHIDSRGKRARWDSY